MLLELTSDLETVLQLAHVVCPGRLKTWSLGYSESLSPGYATWSSATGTGSEADENVYRNRQGEAKSANNAEHALVLGQISERKQPIILAQAYHPLFVWTGHRYLPYSNFLVQ